MKNNEHDGSKRVKNIAAVLYLLVLAFLVGGSYLHQRQNQPDATENQARQ